MCRQRSCTRKSWCNWSPMIPARRRSWLHCRGRGAERGVPALLPVAKRPAQPRAGAVVASREVRRRPVVPVAIERDIPCQVAEDLHIIRSIHIEMDATGLGDGRQQNSGDVQGSFVEPEEFRLPGDQAGFDALRALRDRGMLIVRVLPAEAAEQRDGSVVGVLQITSNAAAECGLQLDVLLVALQESTEASVEPIVPAQEAQSVE